MTTAEQDRTKFIGSSEISAVMGIDPYKSPLRLWASKTGRIPQGEMSEAAEWGTRLESVVAEKFSEKHDVKLMAYKKRFIHPKYPFISCELDRIITGTDEIVEVKTCNEYMKKNWVGEDMPQNYCVQLNTALGLSKRKKGWVALLAGGQKYIEKHLTFDQELYDMTIQKAVEFWNTFVLADLAPVATGQDNEDTLDLLYPQSKEGVLALEGELAQEVDVLVADMAGASESMSHLKEEIDKTQARLKQILGESEQAETANSVVTWKTIQKKEFTVKASSYRQLKTKRRTK